MSESIRTTWRDPHSRLIHAVNIEGLRPGRRGQGYAEEILTDCGIRVPAVTIEDDGDVDRMICLERSWLDRTLAGLEVDEPVAAGDQLQQRSATPNPKVPQ